MKSDEYFYNNKDIQEILQVKESKAYKVMQQLNKELRQKGFLTKQGVVNAKYFNERYGLEEYE